MNDNNVDPNDMTIMASLFQDWFEKSLLELGLRFLKLFEHNRTPLSRGC